MNYTQPDLKVRVVVPFGVEYGNKPEEVIKVIGDAMKNELKGVLDEPKPDVVFTDMGDSSINFAARFWVSHYGDAYAKKLETTDLIYNTLNKNKIGIPFPTRTLYLRKD
jgi:small-conductance mechanosensitive channel